MTDIPLIIIQARAGGTRFPKKMLAPLLWQPLILWTLQRIRQLSVPHRIVVALPATKENTVLRNLCERHGYECLQPEVPEQDVLGRYAAVARLCEAWTIVRCTADCALVDAEVIRGCLEGYGSRSAYDHYGIAAEWMEGMDCEVFSTVALHHAANEAEDSVHREHVTSFLWSQPLRFRCGTYPCPMDLTAYQTSIDTPQDLLLVRDILTWCLDRYGFDFTWRDIWWCVEQDPSLKQRILQRSPRNHSYVTQVGATDWEKARYYA